MTTQFTGCGVIDSKGTFLHKCGHGLGTDRCSIGLMEMVRDREHPEGRVVTWAQGEGTPTVYQIVPFTSKEEK